MCIKKILAWFHKPPEPLPEPVEHSDLILLTFGKNNYGGGNDLRGCVNDSKNLSAKLLELIPSFYIKKFLDADVTVARYKSEVSKAIDTLNPGAVVVVMADSCFSESITRLVNSNPHPIKNRFINPELPPRINVGKKLFKSRDIRWIVMSGCQEHQTSADAYIDGKYVGAFTYFAIKALKEGMTYREWHNEILRYLPGGEFNQVPTLEGPEELLNKVMFEDETLIIHNSSHGTYTYDEHGDEEDGYDEALYFDKMLIDDDLGEILDKIK